MPVKKEPYPHVSPHPLFNSHHLSSMLYHSFPPSTCWPLSLSLSETIRTEPPPPFSPPTTMADRQPSAGPRAQRPVSGQALLRRLHDHSPTSTQVVGFLTLVISSGILLLLTGLTLAVTLAGLVFFGPIILLTSPIWFPVGAVILISIAGFLSACGCGVAVVAGATWLYSYFSGRHPVGSERVDYARSRIADTASHMKDYAREYGGYLQSRVKDAAPGA